MKNNSLKNALIGHMATKSSSNQQNLMIKSDKSKLTSIINHPLEKEFDKFFCISSKFLSTHLAIYLLEARNKKGYKFAC